MKSSPWMSVLEDNELIIPCRINWDCDYFPILKKNFTFLIDGLKLHNAPECLIKISENYISDILSAIDCYYKGNIIKSHSIIANLIDDCCADNEYAITNINDSIAFPYVTEPAKSEVQFFRARLNESVEDYPAKEMLHIPFINRSIVKSERFSIPGLPSLYLGNTSYVCWLEMGRPTDFRFNVSPVLLDNSQKIFNLTVTLQNFYNAIDLEVSNKEIEQKLSKLMKIYLLNYATSFNVSEQNRNFKSEYIISQMIMLACKNKGLNGITYHSKKVSHDIFASILGVNLVLFADYNGERDYSSICDHIENGDSFNYSMFKQLLPSLNYKDYCLRIDASAYIKNIGTFTRQFPYRETQFYMFDKYLFANWDRRLKRNYQ